MNSNQFKKGLLLVHLLESTNHIIKPIITTNPDKYYYTKKVIHLSKTENFNVYSAELSNEKDYTIRELTESLKPEKVKKIKGAVLNIDMGEGTGLDRFLKYIPEKKLIITGFDISGCIESIIEGSKKSNIEFISCPELLYYNKLTTEKVDINKSLNFLKNNITFYDSIQELLVNEF